MAFLLFFPGRCDLPPAFIFLASKPVRSPELMASPDLAWRFLPPKPNLSSFFFFLELAACGPARLSPCLPEEGGARLPISLSTATSKRSPSWVLVLSPDSWRSGDLG